MQVLFEVYFTSFCGNVNSQCSNDYYKNNDNNNNINS